MKYFRGLALSKLRSVERISQLVESGVRDKIAASKRKGIWSGDRFRIVHCLSIEPENPSRPQSHPPWSAGPGRGLERHPAMEPKKALRRRRVPAGSCTYPTGQVTRGHQAARTWARRERCQRLLFRSRFALQRPEKTAASSCVSARPWGSGLVRDRF